MVKLVRITVDPLRLDEYKRILKEEVEISLRSEEGVYVLYTVWDEKHPNQFTILEIYKDQEAYDLHLESPQLKKYFEETKDLVLNIEAIDAIPLMDGIRMK